MDLKIQSCSPNVVCNWNPLETVFSFDNPKNNSLIKFFKVNNGTADKTIGVLKLADFGATAPFIGGSSALAVRDI